MSAWRKLTGTAELELRGVEPERMLSALTERSIGFWNAEKPDDFTLRFSVPLHEEGFVKRLAESRGMECRVLRTRGLPKLWRELKKRRALLVCLALAAVALGVSRLFIWRVEVPVCPGVSESELRAAMAEVGADVGAYWPGLSQDLVRNALLRRIPSLRWATVNVRGCTAELIARPKREKPALVPEGETADIAAAEAGFVTEVLALRGTARVKPGSAVLPGDTLIEGVASGRFETHGAVRALGSVRALCRTELTAAAPERVAVKTETGQTRRRFALIFGKRRINLFKGCSICPAGCAKISEEAFGAALPLRLVRETLVSYGTEERTADALPETLCAAAEQALLCRLGDDGELTALSFSQSRADGVLYVTAHAECEKSIGITVSRTQR